jgi:hypothetical protein
LVPGVEAVEQRLSLSAVGVTAPSASAPSRYEGPMLSLELENTLISSYSAPTPHPGGSQQIIAILIGQ